MANRFDTALFERENTRRKLAEALDSKYEAERRSALFSKLLTLAVLGGVGYYITQGVLFVAEHTKSGLPPQQKILADVKKQMAERDKLLIGEASEPDTASPPPEEKLPKKPGGYDRERIPLNLYADLKSVKPPPRPRPGCEPRGHAEHAALLERSRRRPAIEISRYRPATAVDLAKIPQRTIHPAAAGLDQRYARLPNPPAIPGQK